MEDWSLVGCWRRVPCDVSESHSVFMSWVKQCKKSVWPLSRRQYNPAKLWESLIKWYIVTPQDTNRLRYRWQNLTSSLSGTARRDVDTGVVSMDTWQLQRTYMRRRGRRRLQRNCSPIIIPLQPSGHYMYHQFNIQQFYVLPTQCIYMFCVDLRTNSDYFTI